MSVVRKPEQVFDIRLLERYRAKGVLTDKEYKKWLAELEDVQGNADFIPAKDIIGAFPEEKSR